MKKLNNKGFAISTMLYGILMMVILILYLILSIMNSGLGAKRQMVDDELKYINKCYNRKAAVERCFKTYNVGASAISCSDDYEAYTACMGYEANSTYSSSTATIKETVIDYADMYSITKNNSTLVLDESRTGENRYIFVGADPNNYIKIGGRIGRILSIENNGVVKVVLTDKKINNIKIDIESGAGMNEVSRWKNSIAYDKLRVEYISLDYTNKMVDNGFYIGIVRPTVGTSLKDVYDSSTKTNHNSVYGTITLEDYLKASSNAHDHKYNCNDGTFSISGLTATTKKCNNENWLATLSGSNDVWTSTPADNLDKYYVIGGNKVTVGDYDTAKSIFLVVCLSPSVTVNTRGTGTQSNPYIISLK